MRSLVLAALLALGCSPGPEPCVSPGTCARGDECLANRCVPAGGTPVPAETERIVLEPRTIAVVSSRRKRAEGAVVFGSRSVGSSAVYLRFARLRLGGRRIASAFLLLEPMPDAPVSTQDVTVRAWRVAERWQPDQVSWLDQPKRSLPRSRGIARGSPPSELRIDVTDIERFVTQPGRENWGIALEASAGDGLGVTYSTGAYAAPAPRLELYLRSARAPPPRE
jgi:hypothetical protein